MPPVGAARAVCGVVRRARRGQLFPVGDALSEAPDFLRLNVVIGGFVLVRLLTVLAIRVGGECRGWQLTRRRANFLNSVPAGSIYIGLI